MYNFPLDACCAFFFILYISSFTTNLCDVFFYILRGRLTRTEQSHHYLNTNEVVPMDMGENIKDILFYKLKSNGWNGRVIDTLWSLYTKSHFRVKRNGKLSPVIPNQSGFNQGGISSGLLFRRYMADLGNYLNSE